MYCCSQSQGVEASIPRDHQRADGFSGFLHLCIKVSSDGHVPQQHSITLCWQPVLLPGLQSRQAWIGFTVLATAGRNVKQFTHLQVTDGLVNRLLQLRHMPTALRNIGHVRA